MKEDFLHYLWKFQKFSSPFLRSHSGERIQVIQPGQHNYNAGPDFLIAQLIIGNQKWAGHVELHIRSSYWFAHQHQHDPNYENVILHVVWEHDASVYRKNGLEIPVLELKDKVDLNVLERYQKLLQTKPLFIPCNNELSKIPDWVFEHWVTRMYIERLEEQSYAIEKQLQETQHNWEAVLLLGLAKAFGLKVNAAAFVSMIHSIPYSVIQKCASDALKLESLFMGQLGLLKDPTEDPYYIQLNETYNYLTKKFHLSTDGIVSPKFFRIRPSAFPTIRLSQWAQLWSSQLHLFSSLMETQETTQWYRLLDASASSYWDTHYRFGVTSAKQKKQISQSLKDLILIHCIVPLKYCYDKVQGKVSFENLLDQMNSIPSEKNRLIEPFKKVPSLKNSALHGQGVLHLKKHYCDQKKCLQCEIGNHILKS